MIEELSIPRGGIGVVDMEYCIWYREGGGILVHMLASSSEHGALPK